VQGEVVSADLFACRIPVEVEAIDCADLSETSAADPTLDSVLNTAVLLLFGEEIEDREGVPIYTPRTFVSSSRGR
jgi:hypothetical protein